MGNVGIFSMVKGRKVTFKILEAESFAGILRVGPSRETFAKLTAWYDSSVSSMCFSRAFFAETFTRELLVSCEIALNLHFMLDSLLT